MAGTDPRRTALAGVLCTAVLAVGLVVPSLSLIGRHGQSRLGVLIMIGPTAALLAVTGRRRYGAGPSVAVALAVMLPTAAVSWAVSVFVLVKALSGSGVGVVWSVLVFVAPAASVCVLGALALRFVRLVQRPRSPGTAKALRHGRPRRRPPSWVGAKVGHILGTIGPTSRASEVTNARGHGAFAPLPACEASAQHRHGHVDTRSRWRRGR
jgi:hypothetical protein